MFRLGYGRTHGGSKELQTDLDLVGGQAERRAKPDRTRAAREQEQTAVKCQVDDPVAQARSRMPRPVLHLQPDHESLSPHLTNARESRCQRFQPGAKLSTAYLGIDAVPPCDQSQGLQGRHAGHGVAAECRGMAAAGPVHHRGPRHDRPQRQSVGNPFGQAHDIALNPPVLAGKVLASPAKSALHFVQHQEHTVLVADLSQAWQKIVRRNDVAALALDRLDEDGRQLFNRTDRPQQGVHAFEIAIAGVMDVRHQRREAPPLHGLGTGERHRPIGPPMKRP